MLEMAMVAPTKQAKYRAHEELPWVGQIAARNTNHLNDLNFMSAR